MILFLSILVLLCIGGVLAMFYMYNAKKRDSQYLAQGIKTTTKENGWLRDDLKKHQQALDMAEKRLTDLCNETEAKAAELAPKRRVGRPRKSEVENVKTVTADELLAIANLAEPTVNPFPKRSRKTTH